MTDKSNHAGVPQVWRNVVQIVVAAVAMTATLPGRTHGLGLITEQLLVDLSLNSLEFSQLNLISALVGSLLSLPTGWLIDRWSIRNVLVCVTLLLGGSVWAMAGVTNWWQLLICLTLVRGLGQSALSLASIAVIAKWFERGVGISMAIYAVLLTFGFIASVLGLGSAIEAVGWARAWGMMGWIIMAIGLVFMYAVQQRNFGPESVASSKPTLPSSANDPSTAWSVRQALQTPTYWILLLSASLFNLVWSSVTLFNESIMREKDLDASQAVEMMAILTGVGLLANLIGGALANRRTMMRLQSVGLVLLAAGLLTWAKADGLFAARCYAALIGASGGLITVVFFSAWREIFGYREWGQLQGGAQLATVLASATGPLLIAHSHRTSSSYHDFFTILGIVSLIVAFISWQRPPDAK